jgi:hypothetical protein
LDVTRLEIACEMLELARRERDQQIAFLVANGVKPAEITRITGLSKQRISQIRAAQMPALQTRTPPKRLK